MGSGTDLKTKVLMLVGLIFGVIGIFFKVPGEPGEVQGNVAIVLDTGFFLFMTLAREGMAKVPGGWSKTRITGFIAAALSLVRVFFTVSPEIEAALNNFVLAAYAIFGSVFTMAMAKHEVATHALKLPDSVGGAVVPASAVVAVAASEPARPGFPGPSIPRHP